MLNGILWALRTGAGWADLADRFPSRSTCFRRFNRWVRQGVLCAIVEALARDLEDRGKINLSECFSDSTFEVAKKKGGSSVGKTEWSKGTKLMVVADATGLPLALHTTSASPNEVTLVQTDLDESLTPGRPERFVGDLAYDSDPLDRQLAAPSVG